MCLLYCSFATADITACSDTQKRPSETLIDTWLESKEWHANENHRQRNEMRKKSSLTFSVIAAWQDVNGSLSKITTHIRRVCSISVILFISFSTHASGKQQNNVLWPAYFGHMRQANNNMARISCSDFKTLTVTT